MQERRERTGFTLIEMLVVIAIIGVLASILLAALSLARQKAKRTRARAEIAQIVTGWLEYQKDYLRFPTVAITEMGPEACAIFRGDHPENPRKFKYMDLRDTTERFCDPWGDPDTGAGVYHVVLDTDNDNQVEVGGETFFLSVAVWSDGPDRENDEGADDDVISWRREGVDE